MSIRFPGESNAYRVARDRLLERERALRAELEAVAAERRALPPGGELASPYTFREAGADQVVRSVPMSELFAEGHEALAIYSFMFPRDRGDRRPGPDVGQTALLALDEAPCPSCTALLDQFDGMARHSGDRISLAVVAKASPERLHTFATERGWRHLRLVSGAGTTYSRDYGGESGEGSQMPMLNVFQRQGDTIRHFWGSELLYAPSEAGQDSRHVGTLEPLWNLFDLTPSGRPAERDEQLTYRCH
jgi:predicted dithiol-disulfide oxidoreductase (DUF899 family)